MGYLCQNIQIIYQSILSFPHHFPEENHTIN
jgi:hypothetical protein